VEISEFYIIEENSLFANTLDKDKCSRIVNTSRKIKHFRKLSEFEIVILLYRVIGHLILLPTSN